ncbi:hypothetical protein NEOLEDRAFT_1132806 [Neolentinus lepideus HHB14362 ss-1]|uniref:Uncharacterized protein n=1 Tax=Neolentinus lepideus HHB14362 ss-1 TaxID=1314782 RepID=A0A165SXU8_9AGAM|nr:hypothetical protein NEOLEDRAFT_1132806 [Neolentinus lepideus HHB14362 ss-1]
MVVSRLRDLVAFQSLASILPVFFERIINLRCKILNYLALLRKMTTLLSCAIPSYTTPDYCLSLSGLMMITQGLRRSV